jgi:hypothetical protein
MTGQGMKHVYLDILKEADEAYFLKGVFGFKVSELLKEIGYHYVKNGYDIEFFYEPLFETTVQATFVKGLNKLFLRASNPSIEPTQLGTRDRVISFYECLDDEKIKEHGQRMKELAEEVSDWHDKCFESLHSAIKIHDEWEAVTQSKMDWKALDVQREEFIDRVFNGMLLNKRGRLTHRLLGTLTPNGASDYLQNITRNLEKRIFIKGLPGTGKSSIMKKLKNEALERGFDVQMVWCGLDSTSIDMVIIPELKFCIFDSTPPHEYFPDPSRPGDEIFDIVKHCHVTDVEEEKIKEISRRYRVAINNAKNYSTLYADAEREFRNIIDHSTSLSKWKSITAKIF